MRTPGPLQMRILVFSLLLLLSACNQQQVASPVVQDLKLTLSTQSKLAAIETEVVYDQTQLSYVGMIIPNSSILGADFNDAEQGLVRLGLISSTNVTGELVTLIFRRSGPGNPEPQVTMFHAYNGSAEMLSDVEPSTSIELIEANKVTLYDPQRRVAEMQASLE